MKAYPSYKESGVEAIGKIPEHWNISSLKRLIHDNLMYGANESAELDDKELPRYIRITDFDDNGNLRENTFRSLPHEIAKDYLLSEGDILFARSGATVGKTFQFKNYNGKACFAGYLIKASPDKSKILSDFLYLFTKSNSYDFWKNSIFIQATIQNIGANKYQYLEVPVPSLAEQKVIADYLNRKTVQIDTLIEKKQRQIDLLQEQRTALINYAVTKGLNPDVRMKDSGVEWLGEIPSHWDLLHLRRGVEFLTDFEANGSFSTIKDNVEVDIGEPYAWYVRATDLENERSGFDEGNRYCNEETYRFLTKTELIGGELLITKRGEIGKAYLMPKVDMPATLAPNLYLVRLNHKLHPPFAYHWFTSAGNPELVLADKSTTIGALYKEDVKNCRCLFPPINEQVEIAEYLQKIKQEFRVTIEKIYKEIELVQEYRAALISEAVTGKIDVRTAETVHE